jgi:hypothetical protein
MDSCTCPDDELATLQSILEPISGDALYEAGSPQYKALNWLANEDPAGLSVEETSSETIENRYVAAVLYYAFDGGDLQQYNFLSESDVCTWKKDGLDGLEYGIACDSSDNIVSLRLRKCWKYCAYRSVPPAGRTRLRSSFLFHLF